MSITVTVTDMSCDGCEDIVEGAVSDVSGVESVEVDRADDVVTVEGDAEVDEITRAIDFAGYTPEKGSVTEGEDPSDEAAEPDDPDSAEANEGDVTEQDDEEDDESAEENDDSTADEADEASEGEDDTESDEE